MARDDEASERDERTEASSGRADSSERPDRRETSELPEPPELPAYVLDPLRRQSPERLETVAAYARELAAAKRAATSDTEGVDDSIVGESSTPDGESSTPDGESSTIDGVDADPPSVRDVGDPVLDGNDESVPGCVDESSVESQDEVAREAFASSDYETDTDEYEDVPSKGAYITIKEPKPGYRYFYWQWRDGDVWRNEYVGPVDETD